ncbi:MAG: VapE domain-containing protein [Lachnospiraceae bacterium]
MELKHDRQITISAGNNRKSISWKPQTLSIAELWERLRTPARGTETQAEYFRMAKKQQDDLKDVGGFVAGTLSGGRRKANAVTGRDVITLDFDNIPNYKTAAVIEKVKGLCVAFCIYSTRKHTDSNGPRLRILFPLDRTITADEYEPCARRMAEYIGIEQADPTTFEPSRLMYWPSCSADGEYVFEYGDAPLVSAEGLLATYTDWRDFTAWPQVPGKTVNYKALAVKQGNPEEKPGLVGAFCRIYDIPAAMEKYLPGLYEVLDSDPNRYTYLNGSTAGGALTYDNNRFLYSHHATDPCSGRLVNAFDMVRLHKFGELDDEAKEGTPSNRLPSYTAMCELAVNDTAVVALMSQERIAEAINDFQGVAATADNDTDWMLNIRRTKTGTVEKTIQNIRYILSNDPNLKGRFALNEFSGRREVLDKLPWNDEAGRRLWSDTDNNGLYEYMESCYGITGRGNIDAAIDLEAAQHSFNEVTDYLNGLSWDGTPRLDTLLIDYLGAVDDCYTRAVSRKAFTAAVNRAMVPGCKFDNMLILCGPQGIGKSTLLDKMSRGWFNDSIRTFEGKEASELLPGVWIVEVAELDAFKKSDVSRIKQFLSLRIDRYRAAYGRNMSEFKRRCIFFGTCNQMDFLQDTTGNRRFWPVDVGINARTKTVWKDLDSQTIDQIWAEAKARWQMGEPLYLMGEVEKIAQEKQEQHREASPREGMIIDFVRKQVPDDWSRWSLDRRRDFWNMEVQGNYTLVERDHISPIEVWRELFNGNARDYRPADMAEIRATIDNMPEWKRAEKPYYVNKDYGSQRGFIRRG